MKLFYVLFCSGPFIISFHSFGIRDFQSFLFHWNVIERKSFIIFFDLFLFFETIYSLSIGEVPNGKVANVRDCDIIVNKFKVQLHQYVHFRTNIPRKH